MGKKIIISESQYRRVFLSEQKKENTFTPIKATSRSIQTFLNDKGATDYEDKKLKYDGYGDRTASAFAKYYFGPGTKVKDTKSLWMKLKLESSAMKNLGLSGYDVGNSYTQTSKIIKAMADIINYKESPTTGVQDFFKDLLGSSDDPNNDGLGISFENLKKYKDRLFRYGSDKFQSWDEGTDNYLYDKHITSKEEGDKFREWVHSNPKILELINKDLKEIGFGDGLSKSGSHDNIYFLLAWDVAGAKYLNDTVREYMSDEQWYDKIADNIAEELEGELKNRVQDYKQNYRNSNEYQVYLKALSQWDKVSKKWGWDTSIKKVALDGNNFLGSLEKAAESQTICIDPSWVLMKKFVAENKLILLSPEKYKGLLEELDKNTSISEIRDYGEMMKKIKTINNSMINQVDGISGAAISVNEQSVAGAPNYGTIDRNPRDYAAEARAEVERQRKQREWASEQKIKLFGANEVELLVIRNNYKYILEKFIMPRNTIIAGQLESKMKWVKTRSIMVNKHFTMGERNIAEQLTTPLLPMVVPRSTTYYYKDWTTFYYNMKDVCNKHGGVFLYYDGKDPQSVKNPYVCCAKKTEGTVSFNATSETIYTSSGKELGRINQTLREDLSELCHSQNVQEWGVYLKEKAKDCVTDWHCIVDIASIVLSFFGPIGIISAAVLDGISALGYLVEDRDEEGFNWDALLTGIGVIPGLGEVSKLAKGGPKVSKALFEIGKIPGLAQMDQIEAAIALEKVISKLSKTEKESIIGLMKTFNAIDDPAIKSTIKNAVPSPEQIKALSTWEKDLLDKLTKKLKPEEFILKYSQSGNDLKKMLGIGEKVKDVVRLGNLTQISLFSGMYLGSDQIGKFLVDVHKKYGWDPFGLFDEDGKQKEDTKDNPLSKSVENVYIAINKEEQERTEKENEELKKLEKDNKIQDFIKTDEISPAVTEITQIIFDITTILINVKERFPSNENIQDYAIEFNKYIFALSSRGVGDEVKKHLNNVKEKLSEITDNSTEVETENILKEFYNEITNVGSLPPKLTPEQVQVQLFTGDPNKTDTTGMETVIEVGKELGNSDTEETIKEYDVIIENKKNIMLNEEINRIKSLFTDERLYGNLVNEVCDDEEEAKEFLKGKGYLVSKTSKHDVCMGDDEPLGKVYNYLKGDYTDLGKFNINPFNDGTHCMLKFRNRNFGSVSGQLVMFTLFYGEDGEKQWNSYYELKDDESDMCPVAKGVSPYNIKIYLGIKSNGDDGLIYGDKAYYGGGKWIKFGGDWTYNETGGEITEVNLLNGLLLGVYDKSGKDKVGEIDFEVPFPGNPLPVTIDLGITSTNELMKGSSGCGTIDEILEEKLGFDITASGLVCNIKQILDKVK